MKIVANWLVGEVVEDIVIGARGLRFDYQSGQVKRRVATPAAYFAMVSTKNFHFVFRRCDWLDQLREYAASNEIFCLFLFYYHHSTPFRTTRLRIIR